MDSSELVGRTLGHHHVLELVGVGGMGAVYKARDLRLGRLVALKVIRPESAGDSERRLRFLREARSTSSLNHPNILTVYEIDTDGGVDFIAMEYIESATLADLLVSGPLPIERALRLARQVIEALTAAHAAGVVHRDLKPSNVMVASGDRVKVVDFGLAKLLGPASPTDETADAVTALGTVLGTAAYMSPEQADGRPVDARSDLFSVGTIIYEMLSGRRPFAADSTVGILAAVLRDAPEPITGIPADVHRLLDRCLEKDPAERFQSAGELLEGIEACLAPPVAAGKPSVAVLPFANMSGAREDDFLCEGLAEEVIGSLTRITGLRVIARTSSFVAAREGLDIREVGRRLGAETILEGSVRRAGNRVRITAQLIDASDGVHLWSERYDRELTDVLALEDEIAAAVATRLRVTLAEGGREERRAPVDVDAYAAYLEGRHHFAKGTPEALAEAKVCFERARARDASFALACDSLAELYWYLGFFGAAPPREAFSQSTWYAMRALELDDSLAETHALLGMLRKELDYNWPEVDRELRRALELNRQSPLVRLRYAISGLLPHGRMQEAVLELEAVVRSDPLSLFMRWWLGIMLYLGREPTRMLEEGRRMTGLDPHHFFGHWVLGMGLELGDAPREAVPVLERAHELSGRIPFTLGYLAYAYGRTGRPDSARALLEQAGRVGAATYVPPFTHALGHIGLAEWDAAFEWMERSIEFRDPLIMPIKTYPLLDPVRDDARYLALLRKMNL